MKDYNEILHSLTYEQREAVDKMFEENLVSVINSIFVGGLIPDNALSRAMHRTNSKIIHI